jgi:glutathione S-transferase
VVNLVPGTHAALLRPLGFRHGTVPALRLDGRRVQGSRAIARAIEETQPARRCSPPTRRSGSGSRRLSAGATRSCSGPRRLAGWINVRRPELRTKLAREAGVPASHLVGSAGWPVAWYFAHKVGANDTEGMRRTVGMLPALLDHVEELLDEGTIGGKQRNADFQIGTSVRLLMTFEDLAPAMRGRKAARFATELMPDYPTGIPAGFVPQEWLEPLRGWTTGQTR